MIIGIAKKPANKRTLEDEFVKQINIHGTDAVVSYNILPEDKDGNKDFTSSPFALKFNNVVIEQIDKTVEALAEIHLLPKINEIIETMTMQKTNDWGEKIGQKLTFIEYLAKKAGEYMNEQVDYQGKPKFKGSYDWKGTQTRITYLLNQHLHYSIEEAMKNALQITNSAIASGIQETVRLKLAEISTVLKIGLDVKKA